MIKRAGIGAAVIWSVPALTTVASPAFAGSPTTVARCPEPCGAACAGQTQCGTGGLFDYCGCTRTDTGQCFCWANSYCADVPVCTTTTDCPAGSECVTSCCDEPRCLPSCPNPGAFGAGTSVPAGSGTAAG